MRAWRLFPVMTINTCLLYAIPKPMSSRDERVLTYLNVHHLTFTFLLQVGSTTYENTSICEEEPTVVNRGDSL